VTDEVPWPQVRISNINNSGVGLEFLIYVATLIRDENVPLYVMR
jgi:hypothetical protein